MVMVSRCGIGARACFACKNAHVRACENESFESLTELFGAPRFPTPHHKGARFSSRKLGFRAGSGQGPTPCVLMSFGRDRIRLEEHPFCKGHGFCHWALLLSSATAPWPNTWLLLMVFHEGLLERAVAQYRLVYHFCGPLGCSLWFLRREAATANPATGKQCTVYQ